MKKQNIFFINKSKNQKLNNQNKITIFKNVVVKYDYENGKITKTILLNKNTIDAINQAITDYMLADGKSYLLYQNILATLNKTSNNQLKTIYGKSLLDNIVTDKVFDHKEKLYTIDIKLKLSSLIQSIYNQLIVNNQNN